MKTYKNLYSKIISLENLFLAYKKARKHKTKKKYVKKFETNLRENLLELHEELNSQTYLPKPLKTFILRDPKTRKISKSAFRDRVIHHAICLVIEPIFDKTFIFDNCANRKGKGSLFALKRLERFKRKVTENLHKKAYCLKADIKHYFQEIDQGILLCLLWNKIKCEKTIWLLKRVIERERERERERDADNLLIKECLLAI